MQHKFLFVMMALVVGLGACDKQSNEVATVTQPNVKDNKTTKDVVKSDAKDVKTPAGKDTKGVSAKEKDIRLLLDVTGSGKLGKQVMDNMIVSYRKTLPNVPSQFWDDFQKEASADSLVDLIVPIYDKHFTHDDIKGMIAFYRTPLGKKMTSSMPKITQESMAAGQKWGMALGMKVQNRLKKEGHLPKK